MQFEVLQGFSPTDAAELAEDLITRYENAQASLANQGITQPNDDQIGAEMLTMLESTRELYADFTGITRC